MAQWSLTDNSTGSPVVLSFEWNPIKVDTPGRSSSMTTEQATAPGGAVIFFQGRDNPQMIRFEGGVGSETFYDDLNIWKDKFYPLVLTDDQGSSWNVIFKSWSWDRVKRRNPWRYNYTAEMYVL